MAPLALLLALSTLASARPDCVAWMNKDRHAPAPAASGFQGYRDSGSFPSDVRRVLDVVAPLNALPDARLEYLTQASLPPDANAFQKAACRAGAAANDANKTVYVCDALAGIVEDRADLVFVLSHELAHVRRGDATASSKAGSDASAAWSPSLGDEADFVCGRVLDSVRVVERAADAAATEFIFNNREELERRLELHGLKADIGASVVLKRKEFYNRLGIGEDKQHDSAEERAQLIRQLAADLESRRQTASRVQKALGAVPDGF